MTEPTASPALAAVVDRRSALRELLGFAAVVSTGCGAAPKQPPRPARGAPSPVDLSFVEACVALDLAAARRQLPDHPAIAAAARHRQMSTGQSVDPRALLDELLACPIDRPAVRALLDQCRDD